MAIGFVAEPLTASKLHVQQGLRDFLSFVARLGALGVLRYVTRDLRDLFVA